MTIQDLYNIALENNALDYEIQLQYQDGGGCYMGHTSLEEIEYDYLRKEVILA